MRQEPTPLLPHQAQGSEWRKFIASFSYAFQGLWYTLRTQRNARIHTAIAILAIAFGAFLRISTIEFAILLVTIAGVFMAELFNTVIESCVDLASPEYHPLAKIAKDVAAGAVLLTAILAVMIGLCLFGPHLLTLYKQ